MDVISVPASAQRPTDGCGRRGLRRTARVLPAGFTGGRSPCVRTVAPRDRLRGSRRSPRADRGGQRGEWKRRPSQGARTSGGG